MRGEVIMGDELRKEAQKKQKEAERLRLDGFSQYRTLPLYLEAIKLYEQIQNKKREDFYWLYDISMTVAILKFNKNRYLEAVQYYLYSIQSLEQTAPLGDEAHRRLTERCIDLAKTYNELSQLENARHAIVRAINHFKAIKHKTEKERALGEPAVNFKAFFSYYRCELSIELFQNSIADLASPPIEQTDDDEDVRETVGMQFG